MTEVGTRVGELVHGRLDGLLEVVERPRLHLAYVAVCVDDPALDLLRSCHDHPLPCVYYATCMNRIVDPRWRSRYS